MYEIRQHEGGATGLILRDALWQQVSNVRLIDVKEEILRYFPALFGVVQTERREVGLDLEQSDDEYRNLALMEKRNRKLAELAKIASYRYPTSPCYMKHSILSSQDI